MTTASRRRVAILGSTGSIGRQTIEVLQAHPTVFEPVALVAGSDRSAVEAQAAALGVRWDLGDAAAVRAATSDDVDVVVNAIVGAAGLRASEAALVAGKTLALANKESLVVGGEVCLRAARTGGGQIVPVDSEHSALAQCLEGIDRSAVQRVVLTASGGPFRQRHDLDRVSVEDALEHPTWSMGPKITIDSATLMNKGLEIIEAHFLFGLDYDRIGVVVHPQSIVHAIVEMVDGTSMMQTAPPDMRIPILAALAWPDRIPSASPPVDVAAVGSLVFEPLDERRFRSVGLAVDAGRHGRSYPAALNAANEEAVTAFLGGGLRFVDIPRVVEDVLDDHDPMDATELEAVLDADRQARRRAAIAIAELAAGAVSG